MMNIYGKQKTENNKEYPYLFQKKKMKKKFKDEN